MVQQKEKAKILEKEDFPKEDLKEDSPKAAVRMAKDQEERIKVKAEKVRGSANPSRGYVIDAD